MDEEKKKVFRWKPHIIAAIIVSIIGTFIVLLFCVIIKNKKPLSDGFTVASFALFTIAVFMWLGREGVFDIFAYGFKQFSSVHFTKNPNQFKDFPGYKEQKYQVRTKRAKTFVTVFIIAALFLLLGIIFMIVWNSKVSG